MSKYVMADFYSDVEFSNDKIMIKKILETTILKEIRICLSKDQLMREHVAPRPIVVMVLEGEIVFKVDNEEYVMQKGNMINLEENVLHSLIGIKDSIVRLSLSK